MAVQELWASQNLAPKILWKNLEFSPSFAMIAMHYCDPKDGWKCCANMYTEEFERYHPKIKVALQKAHALRDENDR